MRLQPRLVIYTILCLLALPAGALAATFTVSTSADAPDASLGNNVCQAASGQCTLRAAVQEAGSNADTSDTIILPARTYQLTIMDGGQDEGGGAIGDLDATAVNTSGESLTITGGGARTTQVVATGDDRVLDVVSSALTTNISGVTFSGGDAVGSGGGIRSSGPINLTNVAIVGNKVTASGGQGGGLYASTSNSLTNVTITGNIALGTDGTAQGGGMYSNNGTSNLSNVTISGNAAGQSPGDSAQGGGLYAVSTGLITNLQNVTIAGNTITGTATDGGGLFGSPNLSLANSIVGLNTASGGTSSNCGGPVGGGGFATSIGHNLESGTDCTFGATGDKHGVNPLLGPLQNNGGPTDTRALLGGSPALDAGAGCPSTDQRGVLRPQNSICDIGAFELVPPVLPPDELPDPVLGKTVNVGPVSGKVFYALPPKSASIAQLKGLKFKPLKKARQLPVRSFLNTRRGTVRLTSSRPTKGKTQSGLFNRGLFQVLQSRRKKAKGVTELRLKGSSFTSCKPRKRGKQASAALSKKALRRLRANAKGRFRTRGRYGAATVRGTKWLTADRCDGTLVKVTRGKVAVRDFRRKKTVLVRTGKSYLAKARVR